MSRWIVGVLALSVTVSVTAVAQHEHQVSPYAGGTGREIKALSDGEVNGLLAGDGMGFALAAELNHYPGPRHTLELGDALELTPDQRFEVTAIMALMQREALRLGSFIVARERQLDRAFAGGSIDEAELTTHTAIIGRLQGELRLVHLRAHLAVRNVLTLRQVRQYDALRGYPQDDPGVP